MAKRVKANLEFLLVKAEGGFRDLRLPRTEGRSDEPTHGEGLVLDWSAERSETGKKTFKPSRRLIASAAEPRGRSRVRGRA